MVVQRSGNSSSLSCELVALGRVSRKNSVPTYILVRSELTGQVGRASTRHAVCHSALHLQRSEHWVYNELNTRRI